MKLSVSVLQKKMIEKFQCNGCLLGSDTKCGSFSLEEYKTSFRCKSHHIGTMSFGAGRFAPGLPKGFCRIGEDQNFQIWFWPKGEKPKWDKFNVPVWALDEDGFLFVRTYLPRVNQTKVEVVQDGDMGELCPGAIDVGLFIDDID